MQEAKFYQKKENNIVQCRLCSHFCLIADNKFGLCRTRKNIAGKLYSLIYAKPAAINIDPIEKKPFFHFMPGTLSYSIGTLGCNFACANCLNWNITQIKNLAKNLENTTPIDPEKIISEAIYNDCRSIAYTYNEPTIWTEYALDIMKLAHDKNIKNVWVSNGYMSQECSQSIIPYLDAINIDLKSMDEKFYKNNCRAKLGPVLEILKFFKKEQVHLEVTTLIIPSLSSDLKMLKEAAEFIASELDTDTPWHISKFSPDLSWKLKELATTGDDLIYQAYEIGKDAGLRYVYVGNIPGDQKENTYCPKCGESVINRFGYHIERFDKHGNCPQCDKNLDIIE